MAENRKRIPDGGRPAESGSRTMSREELAKYAKKGRQSAARREADREVLREKEEARMRREAMKKKNVSAKHKAKPAPVQKNKKTGKTDAWTAPPVQGRVTGLPVTREYTPRNARPDAPWERSGQTQHAEDIRRAAVSTERYRGSGMPDPEGIPSPRRRALLSEPTKPRIRMEKADRMVRAGMWAAFLALAVFTAAAFFRVDTVEVCGAETVSAAHVVELSDIRLGDRTLLVNPFAVRKNILDGMPKVGSVGVKLAFPDTVVITIKEREPVIRLTTDGVTYLLDEDCRLLEFLPDYMYTGSVPLTISGLKVTNAVTGKVIGLDGDLRLATMQKVLDEFFAREDLRAKTGRIDCSSITDISFTYDGRLRVCIGSITDITKKLDLVEAVLPKLRTGESGVLYAKEEGSARFISDHAAEEE